jgi:hypothetical protein
MIDVRRFEATPNAAPQSILYSPQLDQLVLADGSSKGVVFVRMSDFSFDLVF